jgi:hypothetical protein
MAVQLTVNGNTYNYPVPGEDPTWGSDATDWAIAVTDALATLLGPGDILSSTFAINNDVSTSTNINGLIFDPGVIRSANIQYNIYRTSDTNPSGYAETGSIYIVYDDNAAVNEKWKMIQKTNEPSSGVVIEIGDTGQLTYKSSDIGSVGYSGSIRFSAKALTKI